ncbi:MAG: hypothetical protein OEY21_03055 [Nitrospira sp.]|nr:hypothetical protein [Nitrospira sp.]MDH5252018.1 hypothetical protein [Nitrospira sp.]MDH5625061.1 hypothetical protein [Nitrospira sp.]
MIDVHGQQFATSVVEILAMETQEAAAYRQLDNLFESILHRAFQGEL